MKDLIYGSVDVTLIKVSPMGWGLEDSTLPFYLLVLGISIFGLLVAIF